MIGNSRFHQAGQENNNRIATNSNMPANGASFQTMTRELKRLGRIEAGRQQPRTEVTHMKAFNHRYATEGKLGYILAWLIGIPIPVLILVYLLRGH